MTIGLEALRFGMLWGARYRTTRAPWQGASLEAHTQVNGFMACGIGELTCFFPITVGSIFPNSVFEHKGVSRSQHLFSKRQLLKRKGGPPGSVWKGSVQRRPDGAHGQVCLHTTNMERHSGASGGHSQCSHLLR